MIAAVVLAAGLSSRMGQPKQIMRWGHYAMVRQVCETLIAADVSEVVVVTGYAREKVEEALIGCAARSVFNPGYEDGDMMRSFQIGLKTVPNSEAALFVLGDQPQMQEEVVKKVIAHWQKEKAKIVAPSFQRRRGHPILFAREIWAHVFDVPRGTSPRDFLRVHAEWIHYVEVDTDSILRDVDTMDDYHRESPA
ncbi:MAG: nucleotidyltransferase family protein [Chloroflexi bacterium]|nr:nucleotidyltransferase family protein [Chloroflexota bacterium]